MWAGEQGELSEKCSQTLLDILTGLRAIKNKGIDNQIIDLLTQVHNSGILYDNILAYQYHRSKYVPITIKS